MKMLEIIAKDIIDALFVSGDLTRAQRIALVGSDGHDHGGWNESAATRQVMRVLQASVLEAPPAPLTEVVTPDATTRRDKRLRIGDVIDAAFKLENEIRQHVPTFPIASYVVRGVLEKHLSLAFGSGAPPAPPSAPPPEDGPQGVYLCDKCGFELTRMLMRASDGAVAVDNKPYDEPCPNDGTRMRPLTWKEDAERSNRVGLEQMRRADKLQDLITSIQQVAAVHTGVLANQIWRLCEPAEVVASASPAPTPDETKK